jgi:hypothetical protein
VVEHAQDTTRSGAAADRHHVIRETVTMALYLAISLLAVLAAQPHGEARSTGAAVALVWGTTAGLSLAHWLAFRLSGRLFAGAVLDPGTGQAIAGQAAAAALVASLASLPFLLVDGERAAALARLLLAGLVGLFAFATAQRHGATAWRATGYAAVVVLLAVTVALVKNALAGH